MTHEEFDEAYARTYNIPDEAARRSALNALREVGVQSGLRDWVRLIDARLALLDAKFDAAIAQSTSLIDDAGVDPAIRNWARVNRGVTCGKQGDAGRAIADYTTVIDDSAAPARQKANARLYRGIRYGEKGDAERAIADYTAVIDDPAAPAKQKAMACVNRGVAYGEKGDAERAIADYTAVIDDPAAPAEQKAKAHVNRGITYGKQGDAERAIADYTAVIDDPAGPAEQKAKARVCRGISYGQQDDAERKIGDYTAVIDDPAAPAEMKAMARFNRALAYRAKRDLECAKADLERITNDPGTPDAIAELARVELKMVTDGSTAGGTGASGITIDLEPEVKALFRTELEEGRRRKRDFFGESVFDPKASFLLVAREWNSFTPAVPSQGEPSRGGGYFLRHGGVGIVIDPGFDFLEIFAESGGRLCDIDRVVITHAHNDHTAELEAILTLLYEYNNPPEGEEPRHKTVKLYLSQGAARKFSGLIQMRNCEYLDEVVTLNRGAQDHPQVIHLASGIRLTVLTAYHDDVITKDYAVGLGFQLTFADGTERRLLFTGDTALYRNDENGRPTSPEIFEVYPDSYRAPGSDLIVAHIGSIEDFELDKQIGTMGDDSKKIQLERTYDKHLALRGTLALLYFLRPKAAIVSEFGEEMRSIWIKAVRAIGRKLKDLLGGDAFSVFAGDPVLVYDIQGGRFLCHEDLQFHLPADLSMRGVREVRSADRSGPPRPYLFLAANGKAWEDESDREECVRKFHEALRVRKLPHCRSAAASP
jgi:glyoxylase-like metal-dependent hydrolase (beta-lactamase superfamily II)/tetratricopeptide (TPR) repeat protein